MMSRAFAAALAAILVATASLEAQMPATGIDTLRPFRGITVSRVGYRDGVPLEGATAAASVSFPMPRGVRVVRGLLDLSLNITKVMAPGSNLQFFVNGTRRLTVARATDTATNIHVNVPLDANDLTRETVELQVRSFLAVGRDRCIDERLGSAFATILPESNFQYEFDPATVRSPQAVWSVLLDTVRVVLPARALTAEELRLAFELGMELRADSRVERFVRAPAGGEIALDSVAFVRDLLAWRKLITRRARVLPDHPTFAQLGISDLSREYGYRTSWRIPIDLRTLPTDRVPSELVLDVASASTAATSGVQYFVNMNGTLLRTFVGSDDGRAQTLRIALPQYLLTTYNEVRVDVQRHRDQADYCQAAEALYPAQILPSSVLRTTRATNDAHLFTGAAFRLAENFPLYLPRTALSSADAFLTPLVSLARGTWGNRVPRFELYNRADAVQPKEGFVAVANRAMKVDGPDAGAAARLVLHGDAIGDVDLGARDTATGVIQVARVNKQAGIVATFASNAALIPSTPESFGNADVVVTSRDGTMLRVSAGSLPAEVLYGGYDWLHRWAWTPQEIVGIAVFVLALATVIYLVWLRDARARRRSKVA